MEIIMIVVVKIVVKMMEMHKKENTLEIRNQNKMNPQPNYDNHTI